MQFSHQTMSKTTFVKELCVFASKIKMGEGHSKLASKISNIKETGMSDHL